MEPAETQSLRQQIERTLRGAFDPADVLPRLARLARLASPSSDDGIFANHKLAELLVERDPWRAALYVRRALAHRPDDDRPWAILAFCHTLLGNFRCAAKAYEKAIACAPSNPLYAHNLGHLLDVALGQPARALRWLKAAYDARSKNSEIVASYVHALARAGKTDHARRVLERARARLDSRELDALLRWLDQGAPSRPRRTEEDGRRRRARVRPRRLEQVLARGLSHLPLDPRQRERALVLARDAMPPRRKRSSSGGEQDTAGRTSNRLEDIAGLAAAVAYAIVYVDHVPLSQAEVAAPFRVGVADLRGRFAELRAKLDIVRGDARYATTRR
jgi:tetratricopeptide (TPR) repeat protein